jgi:Fungal specific transcription factor domain
MASDDASLYSAVSDLGSLLTNEGRGREGGPSLSNRPASMYLNPMPGGRVIRTYEELADDNFLLPQRNIANKLVEGFFRYATLYAPYVPEAPFRESMSIYYGERQRHPRPVNKKQVTWLALMNLVLAYGCDYIQDLPLSKLYTLSQMFSRRAGELIHSVASRTVTLEVLQAQLLISIHLLTDMQLNRCWAYIGNLLREAQALGLHLDPTDWNIPPLEKELRKRLWWGIYWFDK